MDCLLSLPPHTRRGAAGAEAASTGVSKHASSASAAAAEDSVFPMPPPVLSILSPFGGDDAALARVCVEAAPCDDPRAVVVNVWAAAALEGVLAISADGTIVEASLGAALLLGFRQSELVGSPVTSIMPAALARHHQGFVSKAAASGDSGKPKLVCMRRVVEALHRDGSLLKVALEVADAIPPPYSAGAGADAESGDGNQQLPQLENEKASAASPAAPAPAAFTARIVLSAEPLSSLPKAVTTDSRGDAAGRDAARAAAFRRFRCDPPPMGGLPGSGVSSGVSAQELSNVLLLEGGGVAPAPAAAALEGASPAPAQHSVRHSASSASSSAAAGDAAVAAAAPGSGVQPKEKQDDAHPTASTDASPEPSKSAFKSVFSAKRSELDKCRTVSIAPGADDADSQLLVEDSGDSPAAGPVSPARRQSSTAFPKEPQHLVTVAPEVLSGISEHEDKGSGQQAKELQPEEEPPDEDEILFGAHASGPRRRKSSTIFPSAAEASRLPHATPLTHAADVAIAPETLPEALDPSHPTRKQSSTVFPGHPAGARGRLPPRPGTAAAPAAGGSSVVRSRNASVREITPSLPEEEAVVLPQAEEISGAWAAAQLPGSQPQAVTEGFEGSSSASLSHHHGSSSARSRAELLAAASAAASGGSRCPFGFGAEATVAPSHGGSSSSSPDASQQATLQAFAAAAALPGTAAAAPDVSASFDPELVSRARAGHCIFFSGSRSGSSAAGDDEVTSDRRGGCIFSDAPLGRLPARYERQMAQQRLAEQVKEIRLSRSSGSSVRGFFSAAASAPRAVSEAAEGADSLLPPPQSAAPAQAPAQQLHSMMPKAPLPKKSALKHVTMLAGPGDPQRSALAAVVGGDSGARDSPMKLARSFLKPKAVFSDSAAAAEGEEDAHLLVAGQSSGAAAPHGAGIADPNGDEIDGDDLRDADDLRRKRQAEFQRVRRFTQVLKMVNQLRMRTTLNALNTQTRLLLVFLVVAYLVRISERI